MKKKIIFMNTLYLTIWIIPLLIFARDFLNMKDIFNVLDFHTFRVIGFTFTQALLSSIIAFFISIFPAYYSVYKNNLLSKFMESSIFIPFFFPAISTVVAFSLIGNTEIMKHINFLYSLKAIIVANVFYNSPIFIKYIAEGVRKIPDSLREAGELDGAGKIGIFFKIELPIMLPSIFRAFFLVFTYCFTSFAIILALGGINYSTLEVEIATTILASFDFSKAFSYGIIQLIILSVINILTHNITNYELETEKLKAKKLNVLVQMISVIYIILEYIVVVFGLLFAFYNFYENRFSMKGLKTIFTSSFNNDYPVIKAFFNTSLIALIVSGMVILFVFIFLKHYSKYSNYIILSTMGISSAFLSITLLYLNILYGVPFVILLIIGYFLISIPVAYSFMYQHVVGFKKEILEAAKIDGANSWQLFKYIELPILKNIFISVFMQIFAIVFGEFTISYTMQLGDIFPVMSIVNYSIATDKLMMESSALSSLNVSLIILLFIVSESIKRKEKESVNI